MTSALQDKSRKRSKEEIAAQRADYRMMLETAEACGIKMLSDDKAMKVLAWTYAYAGNTETVFNIKFNEDMKVAQKRANIEGGATPNPEFFPLLKKYMKETQIMGAIPRWALELCKYYELPQKVVYIHHNLREKYQAEKTSWDDEDWVVDHMEEIKSC